MKQLKLSLRENGISFAEEALANAVAAEGNPLRWKFAILSIVQTIELSLKELLFKNHPVFIYKKIDIKTKETVTIGEATVRLQRIAGIQFTKEEEAAIKAATNARNDIVHHQVDEKISALKACFALLLGFLNEFHRKHLGEFLQDRINPQLWIAGVKIKEYGEELYRRASESIKAESITGDSLLTCPKCNWQTLCVLPRDCICYVCGNREIILTCDRCRTFMIDGEQENSGENIFCSKCIAHVTHDFWYEQTINT